MRVRLINLALGASMMVLVAGCSDTQQGTPTASGVATTTAGDTTEQSNEPSTPGSGDRYGAPRVAIPLDATKYLTQPCAAISSRLLQTLNMPLQGKPDTDSQVAKQAGPSCTWGNLDTGEGVDVGFLTGNKNGLADLYRANEDGKWKGYWEETTVEGYPAVFHNTTDLRPSGECNIAVGISDALAFRSSPNSQVKEKACDRAKQVASAVIATLKGEG